MRVVRVSLIGFTPFERATFESFFRLATRRQPSYELCESTADSEAAVVNADDVAAVQGARLAGLLGRSVLLGAGPCDGAGAQLPRPINLMLVVRALDRLVMQQTPSAPPAPSAHVQRVLDTLVEVTSAISAGVDTRALAAQAATRTAVPPDVMVPLRTAAAASAADRPGLDHILVVDDSDIALRFMANTLQRFGFQVHLARSGAEALERVARRHFEFVFLEVALDGLDGFHACKAIKRSTYPDHRPPPTVVLLSSRGTPVDRMRATMAGADAYLNKPLQEADLLKVVGDREVAMHAFAQTAQAAGTVI